MRNIKCVGRFKDLTGELTTALEIASIENIVTEQSLKDVYLLINSSFKNMDVQDPYFNSSTDVLRPQPKFTASEGISEYIELVPLISREFKMDGQLVRNYAKALGAKDQLEEILGSWQNCLDLNKTLGLRLSERKIAFKREDVPQHKLAKKGQEQPCPLSAERASLDGYSLRTKFGVGGTDVDAVVPDAPYGIEVFDPQERLCLLVGFWYKQVENAGGQLEDAIVVSQIQQPQKANLPGADKGAQMGIVGLELAKIVAAGLGVKQVQTYSAETHPMFSQYPERKCRMKGEFTGYYDTSAKALGFQGSRSTFYTLKI